MYKSCDDIRTSPLKYKVEFYPRNFICSYELNIYLYFHRKKSQEEAKTKLWSRKI